VIPTNPPHGTTSVVNRYTLVYAGAGAALGRLGFSFFEAAAVAVAWEIAQRPLREVLPGLFPDPRHDSLAGAVVDTAAVLAGWWIMGRLDPATSDRPGIGT
jgi:hypothetical protein